MENTFNRVFCAIGGLFGAAGIICYSAAAHLDGHYSEMATIFLVNAPVIIAFAFFTTKQLLIKMALVLIILGVCLFELALGIKQFFDFKILPYSAPIGGMTVIIGWLMFTVAAFVPGGHTKTKQ